ncbi:MAG: hypothetical protein N2692_01665 [Patescibacteria group bacterium]|jgi:flagellar basal body-associated protein FliL|nr:hypothetical protein [Patescibacteria group bacterium]
METVEQKPKTNIFIYVIIVILIAAIAIVYFVFFAPEKIAKKQTTVTTVNVATQETGAITSQTTTAIKTTGTTTADITGGLSSLKLTPEEILNNPIFQSLHSYAEPVELPSLGRPNPFIPY